jgi:integrase
VAPRNLEAEAAHRLDSFSPAEARALKLGDWLTFTPYPGLRLHRAGLARTWTYRYRSPVDGKLRQVKLGRWPAVSWEKAVARWEALSQARDEGRDPRKERREAIAEAREKHAKEHAEKKRERITVERVVRQYLEEHIERECRTEKAKYDARWMFEAKVLPELGEKPAHDIDRADATDFLARLKLDSPSLARLLRSRLGGAWDHAIARRLLPADHVNPWRDALKGKLPAKARTRFLDDRELAALVPKLQAIEDADIRDGLLLYLYTGARGGEIVDFDPAAVDLKRGAWTLTETKTDTPRTIRLPAQALAVFESRERRPFAIKQQALSDFVRGAGRLGLKDWNPHDLRRTVRTGLARLGVRDEVAEAALGHVEGGIRGTYNLHAFEAEVGEALQKWCDHLDALQAPGIVPMSEKKRA